VKNRGIRGGCGLVVLELIPLANGLPVFIGKEPQEGGLDADCMCVSKIITWQAAAWTYPLQWLLRRV
jgi:hypothetical protein